ncbi:putative disease resistance protein [Vitis vinifera]|uniref:Putative disease resistance protein n=1 Tax=Vitis vinifera TaxID=29760 RepID=A0A438GLK8_VITVI|nr:putative disease resistance protein [Vitis vinifera]
MEEIVVTIAAKVAEYLVAPIGRSFGYLFNYRSNIDDLRQQVEKRGMPGLEAGKFFEVEKKANQSCFNGSCPNLKSQYQLSREAKKRARVVAEIQGDGKFERVSYRAPLPGIGSAPFKGHEALESRMTTLDEIMEALRDAHVNIIGVWGMAGVGKTTLMKQVAKQAEEEKLFDKVVMAYISSTPELKKIQGELADMLGLKFEEESEMGRAARLCERLKKVKKILIILDDIWTELDLEKVGIPFGDDHKGCKMVLTSRNKHVLSNEMGTQKDFPVEHLQEEEALILFKKMAGDSIEEPDLQSIAIDVAKECAGLPIAIVTVAKALKNKGLSIWEDALRQLKRSIPTNIKGMDAMVYSTLELSYKHLEGDEVKSLFLLCGLMSNKIYIDDLLKYGMGLRLFQGTNTLEEAKNRIDTLVDSLKASKLLLDTGHNSFVRMHDVVRDVAIAILNKLDTSLRLADGISLLLKGAKDLHLRELSGAANVFPKLDREGFLQLKRLHVERSPEMQHIMNSMDPILSPCAFPVLESLFLNQLINLQEVCHGQLLVGSFSYLRIVKVEHCDGLKFLFSMSMARGLSKIEITRCKNMYKMVAQGKEDGDDAVDAILFAELRYLTLQHLPKLRNFCLEGKTMPSTTKRSPTTNVRFNGICSEGELDNQTSVFNQLEGWHGQLLLSFCNLQSLKIKNCASLLKVLPPSLLQKLTEFGSTNSGKLKQFEEVFDLEGQNVDDGPVGSCLNDIPVAVLFNEKSLQFLKAVDCSSLEEVFDMEGINVKEAVAVTQLSKLILQFLPKVKQIWNKEPRGILTFQNFKSVMIDQCQRLKNLFPASLVRDLVQLQELQVWSCGIEVIVAKDNGVKTAAKLYSLK